MAAPAETVSRDSAESLSARYSRIRARSLELAAPLVPEDTVVQSMPDVSPTKWHLAHVTWFFERFVVSNRTCPSYVSVRRELSTTCSTLTTTRQARCMPGRNAVCCRGRRWQESPTIANHVDEHMLRLIEDRQDDPSFASVVVLGLNHEQQHQELLLDRHQACACTESDPACLRCQPACC